MNRAERRRMNGKSATLNKNWIRHPSPKEQGFGSGWVRELDRAYRRIDNSYAVLTREIRTKWGSVIHAVITSRENADIPWSEKQKIKNELFGPESQAVEVFPKESELVDEANSYHLWILPFDFDIPFTLKE